MNIFRTFDTNIVNECQFYTSFTPVQHIISKRKFKFLKALGSSPCWILRAMHSLVEIDELRPLAATYNVSINVMKHDAIDIIRRSFENCVNYT